MKKQPEPFFRRLWRDQRGIAFVYAAIMLPLFFGFAALTFDVGYELYVQTKLRIVAEAAAIAAAQDINETTGTALGDAQNVAGTYLNANWATGLTNTAKPTLTVTGKCLAAFVTAGVPCSSSATTGQSVYNAVSVKATVTAPSFFASLFGFKPSSLSAIAYAAANGSAPPPLNVMFVVDTTQSMTGSDSTCGSGQTRISCALGGVRQVLGQLWPDRDQVGLMTFPGLKSATYVGYDSSCSGTSISSGISPYYAGLPLLGTPLYQIIGTSTAGSTDYRTQTGTNAPAFGLNVTTSSLMLNAVGAGHGCSNHGLQAIGGVSTYYADVITAAQTTLTSWNAHIVANGGTARQNVIIFLSDGDANASTSVANDICCTATPQTGQTVKIDFQCHEAVTAAKAAAAAPVSPNTTKTWVYSVAYGSPTSGSCVTDNTPPKVPPATSPPAAQPYQACQTMTNIASDPTKFYSDDASGCVSAAHPNTTTLSAIFTAISNSMTYARLIDYAMFNGATD
jgi:Flp pilus assembly protein TadG